MMDQKKKAYLIAIAAVALVVICVLLAGLLDGYWPWQNDRDMGGGYTGGTTETTTDTTGGDLDIDVNDDDKEGNFGVIDFDDLVEGNGGEAKEENDDNKDDNDKDDNDKDDNDKDDNDKDDDDKDDDNKDEDDKKTDGGTQVEDGDIAIDF